MGNKFLRSFLILISSFAASVGLASCSVVIDGNTLTTSDSIISNNLTTDTSTSNVTSINSTLIASNTSITSNSTISHNSTTDTTSDSSTGHHSHKYNQQVVTDAYKVSNADCEHAATYYYSCNCGDIGTETFEYGSPLGHDYTEKDHDIKYLVNGADCEKSAVYYYACTRCGKVGEETYTFGEALGHDYSAQLATSDHLCTEADHHNKATYYYSCFRCGNNGTETFEYGECVAHTYNQQVATDEYKAADADCEHAATYYYSCSCGDRSSETFEYGEPLGHDWHYEYFQTSEGEYYQSGTCSKCNEKEKRTIQSINNLSFSVISEEEKTCTVTDYKKFYYDERDNYICIPKMWNDYKVTSIGDDAFKNCTSLSSVTIGNGVTSIGKQAFLYCYSLSSIVIPDSVTSIGIYAFDGCTSLSSVTIGNGVTSIGDSVFKGCSSLSSIIVKEGNTVYDSREDCNAIIETSTNTLIVGCATTIIPDSVTSIGDYAFDVCTTLSSIVIPDSVNSIGNYAFWDCTSLSSIIVKEGNTVYDSRKACNAIIETSTNTLIVGCATTIIPDNVTSIGTCAFKGCTSLNSIVIPDSVTSIGGYVFYGCTSLSDVYYIGSEEQWNAISIGSYNDELKSATIHYNYIG